MSTYSDAKGALPAPSVHSHTIQNKRSKCTIKKLMLAACASALVLYNTTLPDFTTTSSSTSPKLPKHHATLPKIWSPIDFKPLPSPNKKLLSFHQCSIDNFINSGLKFLEPAAPIALEDFIERRDNLAKALDADGIDAFVVEPGYTFSYYGNVTQPQWEVWEPEERPFLMVVRPSVSKKGDVVANTTFLAPSFEAERARLLKMPFAEEISIVEWEEHWNPYTTLLESGIWDKEEPTLMVDEEMRDFIQRGLGQNGFKVVGLSGEVEAVRQTKSQKEIEILRAVNTGTVEAIRAMRPCLYPGLSENEVMEALDNTMRAAGLEPFFDIVLFDDHGSNPHGGTDGSWPLKAETLVLIDVGSHLFGYSSDVCRTFFPPFMPILDTPEAIAAAPAIIQEKLKVWDIVLDAQSASFTQLHANATAASVDIAARTVIDNAGYEGTFTHRVGHGIGIKAHESPYLNKANFGAVLREGMVFTSEPGIYLVDKFGVRHEDILLVRGEGEMPEVLSGIRAKGAWEP